MLLWLRRLVWRSWFYFRVGYGTYMALLIGFASNIIVLYRLGVDDNKYLLPFFPSLAFFTIVALIVAIPFGIVVGLYHTRRTGGYATEASIVTESNPYIYKLVPGKEREVFLPLWIITVRALAKLLQQQESMTLEERRELEETLNKATALLSGKVVGLPTQASSQTGSTNENEK